MIYITAPRFDNRVSNSMKAYNKHLSSMRITSGHPFWPEFGQNLIFRSHES